MSTTQDTTPHATRATHDPHETTRTAPRPRAGGGSESGSGRTPALPEGQSAGQDLEQDTMQGVVPDVVVESFGQRVRAARRRAGMSQAQLAGQDLSVSYVSHLEAGRRDPTPRVVELFEQRLGLAKGYLLGQGWGAVDVASDPGELARLADLTATAVSAAAARDHATVLSTTHLAGPLAVHLGRSETWWQLGLLRIDALIDTGRYTDAVQVARRLHDHPWVAATPLLAWRAALDLSKTLRLAGRGDEAAPHAAYALKTARTLTTHPDALVRALVNAISITPQHATDWEHELRTTLTTSGTDPADAADGLDATDADDLAADDLDVTDVPVARDQTRTSDQSAGNHTPPFDGRTTPVPHAPTGHQPDPSTSAISDEVRALGAWTLGNLAFTRGDHTDALAWHDQADHLLAQGRDLRNWSRFAAGSLAARVGAGLDEGVEDLFTRAHAALRLVPNPAEHATLTRTEAAWHHAHDRTDHAQHLLRTELTRTDLTPLDTGRLALDLATITTDPATRTHTALRAARDLTHAGATTEARQAWALVHDLPA